MLKRLERFMRYKKHSVVVYMFLLVMITFMMTIDKNKKTTESKITLPAKHKQYTQPIIKTIDNKKVTDFFS
jgi:hypothetical protein